jgi:hypothetical protein
VFEVEEVGAAAVEVSGVARGEDRVWLEAGLGEESGEESGERVTGSALGEVWVAGAIDERGLSVASDDGLVSFEDDDRISVAAGQFGDGAGAVGLDLGEGLVEESCGFTGVWGEQAQ